MLLRFQRGRASELASGSSTLVELVVYQKTVSERNVEKEGAEECKDERIQEVLRSRRISMPIEANKSCGSWLDSNSALFQVASSENTKPS